MNAVLPAVMTSYSVNAVCLVCCRANLSDPSNLVIDVDFRIPAAVVKGEYKAQGKVAGFPIAGKGVYNISMSKARQLT
jgi:hypothetical protein